MLIRSERGTRGGDAPSHRARRHGAHQGRCVHGTAGGGSDDGEGGEAGGGRGGTDVGACMDQPATHLQCDGPGCERSSKHVSTAITHLSSRRVTCLFPFWGIFACTRYVNRSCTILRSTGSVERGYFCFLRTCSQVQIISRLHNIQEYHSCLVSIQMDTQSAGTRVNNLSKRSMS